MTTSPQPLTNPAELPAYDTGKSLIVWCVHCGCWHSHGRGNGGSDGNGHHSAHCIVPESPYCRTGYALRYPGPATAEMLKDRNRRRPKGQTASLVRMKP